MVSGQLALTSHGRDLQPVKIRANRYLTNNAIDCSASSRGAIPNGGGTTTL
jgi:hypothetical protein